MNETETVQAWIQYFNRIFMTSVRKVSLTISVFNCAVSVLYKYVTKGLRRVTAQLPISRQLGSNVRPGKTGSVW